MKDDVLPGSNVRFAVRTSLNEFTTRWIPPDNSVYDSAGMLKSYVSVRKTQIRQVVVNMIQRVSFYGLHSASGGILRSKEKTICLYLFIM